MMEDLTQRDLVEPARMPKGTPIVSVKQKAAIVSSSVAREKISKLLQDRLPRCDGQAQITRQQSLHIFQVLNMQWLIETESYASRFDLFFCGELSCPRESRITGQQV